MKNIKATLMSVKNGVSKYDLVYTNNQNEEVVEQNLYGGELIDLLIEEINQEHKKNSWYENNLKDREQRYNKEGFEEHFTRIVELFNSTPKSELLHFYLDLFYLFKTTREIKGK